jgi:hypothetical protein
MSSRRSFLGQIPMGVAALAVGVIPAKAQDQKAKETNPSGGGTATDLFGIFNGAGRPFRDRAIPLNSSIVGVKIRHGCGIDAVQLISKDAKGEKPLEKHGGDGGKEEAFTLEEGEYITGISGRHGTGIDSITIHTNLDDSKRFGGDGGDHEYHLTVPEGCHAIGFVGQAHGGGVTRIGLVYRKIAAR